MNNYIMNVKSLWYIAVLLLILFIPAEACADGGAIFGKLAGKAGQVGFGLKKVGFIIAGLGLISFSCAAIFNKLSWKTLTYIMVSTFILSMMTYVISYVRGETGGGSIGAVYGNSNKGSGSAPGNADSVSVKK